MNQTIEQKTISSHLQSIKLLIKALDKNNTISPYFEAETPEDYFLIEIKNDRNKNNNTGNPSQH